MKAYPLQERAQRAHDLTGSQIEELGQELQRATAGEVRWDRASRLLYATDASIYQVEPAAVVIPRHAGDVSAVLQTARAAGVPVLPRGGGTSLAGQAVNHAVVLDFTPHMGEVLEVNAEEGWARAEPGLVIAQLNRATIGGGIGNNSCGAHSVVHGKTIDQVLGLETVLADGSRVQMGRVEGEVLVEKLQAPGLEGELYRELRHIGTEQKEEIAQRFPQIMRRVSGYNLDDFTQPDVAMDLSRMVVGSEGTLAIVSEAKIKLAPLPKLKGVAAMHFATLVEASEATPAVLEHSPSAVELVDDALINRGRSHAGLQHLARWVEGDPSAVLLVEFYAESPGELEARLEKLEVDMQRRGLGYACVRTADASLQRDMWRLREAGLGLLMSVRGDAKPIGFVEDTAVAPERLGRFVARFEEIVGKHGTNAAYYGHASVGCLHIRPMVNVKSSEGLQTMEAIASEVADLVLEFEGSLSGEHGDGILRGVFTEPMFWPELTDAFRDVKQAFDPEGILNPGKIIDTPSFRENLRLSPTTEN